MSEYHCASCSAPINIYNMYLNTFCTDCGKYFCGVCLHKCPKCEYSVCIECHDENENCKECSKKAVSASERETMKFSIIPNENENKNKKKDS